MDLDDDDLLLSCIIEGETESFPIGVKRSSWRNPRFTVGYLKEKIQEERSLAGIDAQILELWKPKEGNSINAKPKQSLPSCVASARESREELDPTDSVLTVFPDQPPLDRLHIVVRKPDTESGSLKRKADAMPELDDFEQAKRAKLIALAPSDTSKPSYYQKMQGNASQRILDDRPLPDVDVPPAPLLYSGFGHFVDIYNGCDDVPYLSDIDFPALEAAVDDFANKMGEFFESKDGRRDQGLPLLNAIFSCRKENAPTFLALRADSFCSYRSDGHNLAAHQSAGTIVQFRNKIAGITSVPEIEAVAYVAQLNIASRYRSKLFSRWRVPCLGLTVIGHQVTFYAIILLGHQYRLVSLTPTLSCLRSASNLTDRSSLYRAFIAASVLDMHIFADASQISDAGDNGPDDLEHCYLDFQIQNDPIHADPSRLLFLASTTSNTLIVIKFTRRYCAELHALCAKLGHAPQLLAFERLPGGWCGVAMEYILTGVPLLLIPKGHVKRPRWRQELQEVMTQFHGKNLVHGDLRDTNIIVEKDEWVLLVDFDWGGKDGETVYPRWHLNSELQDGRTMKESWRPVWGQDE
ncbi:hypothetical protein F5887DRAFT_1235893 [Amanita rubescens]|nr:hypothetical protein F5887DRAFT_1235893 [Amanita rubescens]